MEIYNFLNYTKKRVNRWKHLALWSTNQADLFCLSINNRLQFIHTEIFFFFFALSDFQPSFEEHEYCNFTQNFSITLTCSRDESPSLLTNLHCKQPRTPLKLFQQLFLESSFLFTHPDICVSCTTHHLRENRDSYGVLILTIHTF